MEVKDRDLVLTFVTSENKMQHFRPRYFKEGLKKAEVDHAMQEMAAVKGTFQKGKEVLFLQPKDAKYQMVTEEEITE